MVISYMSAISLVGSKFQSLLVARCPDKSEIRVSVPLYRHHVICIYRAATAGRFYKGQNQTRYLAGNVRRSSKQLPLSCFAYVAQ